MKFSRSLFIAAAACFLPAIGPAQAQNCERPAGRPFQVYNALFYKDQPDLSTHGLDKIHVMSTDIWGPGVPRSGPPNPAMVRDYVAGLPKDGAPIVLDYEDFDMGRSKAEANAGVKSLTGIVQAFRKAAPDRSLGFYGYLPVVDYWRAVDVRGSDKFRTWQRDNDRASPLVRHVDALYPSLYAFYDDPEGWVRQTKAQICEARRLSSKPVYAFVWPDYHGNGSNGPPRQIPTKFWRLQLETLYGTADGIVLWGGWDFAANGRQSWNANAAWWHETIAFLRTIDKNDGVGAVRDGGVPKARR